MQQRTLARHSAAWAQRPIKAAIIELTAKVAQDPEVATQSTSARSLGVHDIDPGYHSQN